MKKMFKINDNNLVDEMIKKSGIVAHKNNDFLEVDPNMYNYTIMAIMEIISSNQKYEKAFNTWYDSMDRPHNMPDFLYGKSRAGGWEMYGSGINESIIMNYTVSEIKQNWENSKYNENPNNLGINEINSAYIETNELQEAKYEYKKITKFLELFKSYYANKHHMNKNNIKIEFINYGKTELVYVLTDSKNNQYTLLVKQPKVSFGTVLKEAENLKELNEIDDHVIAPIDYFSLYDQELYMTPYLYQARCVASDQKWGAYVPEPIYRFENFTREQEEYINMCMIAKLISLYDYKKEEGIANCKLGGGDFILEKGWEKLELTTENILDKLYLIAARNKISCSLEEYIEIIKDEFKRRTIDENEDNLKINKRGRVAINKKDIEKGIKLGLILLDERKKTLSKSLNLC